MRKIISECEEKSSFMMSHSLDFKERKPNGLGMFSFRITRRFDDHDDQGAE
ncbi:MAG TPA: hypothetical protein PKD96_04145 [Candidatus Absconditabacterales bacterium]|nr:hypothetical protein [Candidatus Absconditabacterales bacterium]HMT27472.1 hypothetical protein [Candidatus Absconditabacterales bacterium]